MNIYLHKIATAVPEKYYTQEFALDFQKNLICDTEKKKVFMEKIYQGSSIRKRHSVITDYDKDPLDYEFYPKNPQMQPEPTTMERNDLFIKESNRLSLKAAEELLSQFPAGFKEKITHLITVSCTGFAAPGFDFYLAKTLNLRKNLDRFHIGFMGCYAAFPAMKLARSICLGDPEARVMIVNVELCSLHYQQKFDPDTVVANAIFADGITAVLVSAVKEDSSGPKLILHSFNSAYTNDSENDMAWKIGLHGFDMKLSLYVPRIINQNIQSIMDGLFQKAGVQLSDIDIWAIHPGGKAILEKLQETLQLAKEDFKPSWDVLEEYGNMSSATIFFVLKAILEDQRQGKIFATAFGPGLTVETGLLEKTL